MGRSGLYRALDAAKDYAAKWDLQLKDVLATGKKPAWWLPFSIRWYTFTFHTGSGIVVVDVFWPGYKVKRFELYPLTGRGVMLPLWAAYPDFTSVTIGWRMGHGEVYKYRWHHWYRSLTDDEQAEYKKRFPPPDYGAWPGFYEEIADRPSSGSIGDHVIGRV